MAYFIDHTKSVSDPLYPLIHKAKDPSCVIMCPMGSERHSTETQGKCCHDDSSPLLAAAGYSPNSRGHNSSYTIVVSRWKAQHETGLHHDIVWKSITQAFILSWPVNYNTHRATRACMKSNDNSICTASVESGVRQCVNNEDCGFTSESVQRIIRYV